MEETYRPLFIHTRRGALIALAIVILFTLQNAFALYHRYVPGHAAWFTRYNFPPTHFSRVMDVITNLFTAIVFAGALIFVVCRARAAERWLVGLWLAIVVLEPLRDFNSIVLSHIYDWFCIIAELALIPIALWMYRGLPEHAAAEEPPSVGEASHTS